MKMDPQLAAMRAKKFKSEKLIKVNDVIGYGIYDKLDECFVGFQTSKGFVSIWNEARKAKLAFAYHTSNTIDERQEEFEIRQINSAIDLYKIK